MHILLSLFYSLAYFLGACVCCDINMSNGVLLKHIILFFGYCTGDISVFLSAFTGGRSQVGKS